MFAIKLFCVALAVGVFGEVCDAFLYEVCKKQLFNIANFNINFTKTEAFMHAYNKLYIPKKENVDLKSQAIVYAYHNEILNELLTTDNKYIETLFDNPMTWCRKNLHSITKGNRQNNEKICNSKEEPFLYEFFDFFKVTQKDALINAFWNMNINVTYFNYIGSIVKPLVSETKAPSPTEYCSNRHMTIYEVCKSKLDSTGFISVNFTKTEAFMHAYNSLYISMKPKDTPISLGILYNYQKELLNEFLKKHKSKLETMFENPMTWCKNNLHKIADVDKNNIKNICESKEGSVKTFYEFFGETQEQALTNAFSNLNIFVNYFKYIRKSVRKYVEKTNIRNPKEFCEDFNNKNASLEKALKEHNKVPYNEDE